MTPSTEDDRFITSADAGAEAAGPLWAAELARLADRLHACENSAERARLHEQIWVVVSLAVRRYLRIHRARVPGISVEEVEDVSSQKSLELVERIVSRSWTPAVRTAPEIAAYVSAAARNALTDRWRTAGRWTDLDDLGWERAMGDILDGSERPLRENDSAEAAEYARSLLECLGALQPRSRYLWFFRAFYELSSKEIAAHPRILLDAGHVDVLMQRTRSIIQQCLKRAGLDASEIPAGVYARVWDASRSWGLETGEESR